MGRTSSNTADYFNHDAKPGKTIFILERRWGNDGYSFWFKLLEILTASEGHFYSLNEPQNYEYFRARMNLRDGISDAEILNLLADLGKIDKELWKLHKIIWCQNLVNALAETLYKRRNHPPPQKPSTNSNITGEKIHPEADKCYGNDANGGISDAENTIGIKVVKVGREGPDTPPPQAAEKAEEGSSTKIDTLIQRLAAVGNGLPAPSPEQRVQLGALQSLRTDDAILGGFQLFHRHNPGKKAEYLLHDFLETDKQTGKPRYVPFIAEWEKSKPNHYTPPPLHTPTADDDAAVALEAARTKQRMHIPLTAEEKALLAEEADPPPGDEEPDVFPEAAPEPVIF